MILYIMLSYLIIYGMMLEQYEDIIMDAPFEAYFTLFLAPISLPIILGMALNSDDKDNNSNKFKL